MSQPNAGGGPSRVFEPTAVAPTPGQQHDWRAVALDPALDEARRGARSALGAALAGPPAPHPSAALAWAAAELALHRCLDLALDRLYTRLDAPRPAASALPADLAARAPSVGSLVCGVLNAPDTRARYVFLEDLLAQLDRGS